MNELKIGNGVRYPAVEVYRDYIKINGKELVFMEWFMAKRSKTVYFINHIDYRSFQNMWGMIKDA